VSKVINDIELTAISLRIKQFVHDLDHTVTHPFDSLGTELMHYHAHGGGYDLVGRETGRLERS